MRWLMKKWCEYWIRDTKDHAIDFLMLGSFLVSVSIIFVRINAEERLVSYIYEHCAFAVLDLVILCGGVTAYLHAKREKELLGESVRVILLMCLGIVICVSLIVVVFDLRVTDPELYALFLGLR